MRDPGLCLKLCHIILSRSGSFYVCHLEMKYLYTPDLDNNMTWFLDKAPHSQKKQLTPLYIFISASLELSLYSWIACLDDDIQLNELFLLRVQVSQLF